MISVTNLSKAFGGQVLFENVNLQFNPREIYGVVGANGSGKSTLLKLLGREDEPSQGEVKIPRKARLGVLRQDQFDYDNHPIQNVVMMGHQEMWAAFRERNEIFDRSQDHFDGDRYAELEDYINQNNGYALEAKASEILEGLGIPSASHHNKLSTLSGGFKLRVLLAQVLASTPDILLLDEPTNHLDILSIRWLEKFLITFEGTSLIVSHDHRFLDNVASSIVDVDYQTIKIYPGNYENFTTAKAKDRTRREKEIEKNLAKIAEQKAFVERFRAKASKARQAQSKLKTIERITVDELPKSSRQYPRFSFNQIRPSGREVLSIKNLSKSFDNNMVLNDISMTLFRGESVAVIGPNGIGKSTLLKILVRELNTDAGNIKWGYETHKGYIAQDHKAQIGSHNQTVESWLTNLCPQETVGSIRKRLASVLFTGDDADKKITALSGGEAARLILAQHMAQKPNVLLLDEPTNHLDLESISALVEALRLYEGTLLFVSHDRWFVSKLADRIIELTPEGMRDFNGNYEEYIASNNDDHLDRQAPRKLSKKKKETLIANAPSSPALRKTPNFQSSKALKLQIANITKAVENTEKRLEELSSTFSDPSFYEKTSQKDQQELAKEHSFLEKHIREEMKVWEQLEMELTLIEEKNPNADSI